MLYTTFNNIRIRINFSLSPERNKENPQLSGLFKLDERAVKYLVAINLLITFYKLQESVISVKLFDFENLIRKVSKTVKFEKVVFFKIRLLVIILIKLLSLILVL